MGKLTRGRLSGGNFHYILGLRPFRAIDYLKFHFLALDQSFIPFPGNRAVMNKYILLARLLNKTISFRIIEPLDQTYSF